MAHELTAEECARLAAICRFRLRRRFWENFRNPNELWSSRLAEVGKKTKGGKT